MIAESPELIATLDRMPEEVGFRTSIFGLHASATAFRDSVDWLDGAIEEIQRSSALLAELLADQLPDVRYRPPGRELSCLARLPRDEPRRGPERAHPGRGTGGAERGADVRPAGRGLRPAELRLLTGGAA
jgi:hypothetical protein